MIKNNYFQFGFAIFFVLVALYSVSIFFQKTKSMDDKELSKWFNSGKWKSGWKLSPDESVNQKEFARQYFMNQDRWDKAFKFLAITDLTKIALGRYELDGRNLYLSVDEYLTKDEENTRFEAHRKYADIQFLVFGEEKIGIAALENTKETILYDSLKDVVFLSAIQNSYRIASSDRFFVFFSNDAHRPGVKVTVNSKVRKIVVKVLIE